MENFRWRWQDGLSGPENGQMTLGVNKCEVMHTGRNNPKSFNFVCTAKGFELTAPDPKWGARGGLAGLALKMIGSNVTTWDFELKMTGNMLKNQKGPLFNQSVF